MPEPINADLEFVDSLKRALVWGQTSYTDLKDGNPSKLQNAAYDPASEYFVDNFLRAVNSGQVTVAQIQDPALFTNIGTNSPADQNFVNDCTRAGIFSQLASVLP